MSSVYTDAYISGMKKQYNFRLEEKLINDLQALATKENRSLTNLIETVMMQYVQTQMPPSSGKGSAGKKK